MSTMNGWPTQTDFPQWMRDVVRDIAELKRRSKPTAAAVLGPGLGPWATLLNDWNDEVTLYNGIFYCDVNSQNSPDEDVRWIGTVMATPDGDGVMEVAALDSVGLPARHMRSFTTDAAGGRSFTAWAVVT